MSIRAQDPTGSVPRQDGASHTAADVGPRPHALIDWRDIDLENGSLRRAAEIVGDKWVMLIVRDAMLGITRFDELQHRLGLSAPVLSVRLRRLVDEGILEPHPYREPGQRTRMEYRLTRKGAELFHALVAIMQWGDRYLADPEGPALTFQHDGCGGAVRVVIKCDDDGSFVDVGDAHIIPGPGAKYGAKDRWRPPPLGPAAPQPGPPGI